MIVVGILSLKIVKMICGMKINVIFNKDFMINVIFWEVEYFWVINL